MTGKRFVEKAVGALLASITADFETQLRAVEVDLGLDPGTLPDPEAYVQTRAEAENNNQSPMIAVYDEGFDVVQQRQRLYTVDCSVALAMVGMADLTALVVQLRRYLTAMIQTLDLNPTLSPAVGTTALIMPGAAFAELGDRSTTRLVYVIPVQVRVHSP